MQLEYCFKASLLLAPVIAALYWSWRDSCELKQANAWLQGSSSLLKSESRLEAVRALSNQGLGERVLCPHEFPAHGCEVNRGIVSRPSVSQKAILRVPKHLEVLPSRREEGLLHLNRALSLELSPSLVSTSP